MSIMLLGILKIYTMKFINTHTTILKHVKIFFTLADIKLYFCAIAINFNAFSLTSCGKFLLLAIIVNFSISSA